MEQLAVARSDAAAAVGQASSFRAILSEPVVRSDAAAAVEQASLVRALLSEPELHEEPPAQAVSELLGASRIPTRFPFPFLVLPFQSACVRSRAALLALRQVLRPVLPPQSVFLSQKETPWMDVDFFFVADARVHFSPESLFSLLDKWYREF
jgi:hypothetical protein